MPRDGSGVMSKVAGTTAVPNAIIESGKYNATIDDIIQDLNTARPVSAGGTGSTTKIGAASALEVVSFGDAQTLTAGQKDQALSNLGISAAGIEALRYTFNTVALLLADTSLTYSTIDAGDYINVRDGGYVYKVAPSAATDHHLTTGAGGAVKLYVLPNSDGSVCLRQFGYVSGDIAAAFAKAVDFGIVRLTGVMTLASEISKAVTDLRIIADKDATITYTGSAGGNRMLEFTSVNSLIIDGHLTLDCDQKVSAGLFIRAIDNADLIDIQNAVTVIDPYQSGSSTYGAGGIFVQCDTGEGKTAIVTGNTVKNVSRSVVGGTCSGIVVTDFQNMTVDGNTIDGVFKGSGTGDADGIKIFNQVSGSSYATGVSSICGNKISNCEGRFIKTQTRGPCSVKGNLLKFTSALDLIVSWRGIDAQIDGNFVEDNIFELMTAWTGGSEAMPLYQRAIDLAPDYTGQPINGSMRNNRITVADAAPDLSRVFYLNLDALGTHAYSVNFDVDKNYATTTAGWGGGSCAGLAGTVRVPVSFAAGAKAKINITDNDIEATNFLERLTASGGTAAHGGLGDLTGKLYLKITGNANPVASPIALLPYSSNDCFTSSIHIADNAVGTYANYWHPPFDFKNVLGGRFYVSNTTTPAHTGGPGSYTFSTVSREGVHLVVAMAGGTKTNLSMSFTAIGAATSWT